VSESGTKLRWDQRIASSAVEAKQLRRHDDSALPSLTKAEISTFCATPEAAAQAYA
jgi:hypothetical protein